MKQLEEVKEHYQAILDDQEQQVLKWAAQLCYAILWLSLQNGATVQELMNSKNDTEKQLKNKTEEAFHIYQKIADLHEERKILIDIMKQLCIEAGRHIDIL